MIHISCMMLGVFTCFFVVVLSMVWHTMVCCDTVEKMLATIAGCFGVKVVVWCVHILSPYSGYDQV